MSTAVWKKIVASSAPAWLETREGRYRTSFRIRYRQDGLSLEQVLEGDFKDWRAAAKEGERVIYEAKYGKRPRDPAATRSEDTCDAIVALKRPLAGATYEQTELFFRKHIKPYLRGECAYEGPSEPCQYRTYIDACPFTSQLTPSHWLNYKAHIRLHRPTVSLFNHWKFWGMLFKFAFEKGLLERPVKLAFDEEKEDFRKAGIVISDEHFRLMLGTMNRTWCDRAIVQRLTGQRPGVVRRLRKDQVDFATGVTKVEKADSKNRRAHEFIMPAPALEILRARLELEAVKDSPYFFPMETDHSRAMDKHLGGWHSALKRAFDPEGKGLAVPEYTPHDLRHTFLTAKFKNCPNPALICFQCDLSLEEAMETYIHFTAEDTRVTADETTREAVALLGGVRP